MWACLLLSFSSSVFQGVHSMIKITLSSTVSAKRSQRKCGKPWSYRPELKNAGGVFLEVFQLPYLNKQQKKKKQGLQTEAPRRKWTCSFNSSKFSLESHHRDQDNHSSSQKTVIVLNQSFILLLFHAFHFFSVAA